MNRERIQEVIALYALLISAVFLQTGCGGYTDPPKEFKDSYIVTEVSGMGELGTIDEFQKGLALFKMDNGKTPEIHGWKKNDNVYQLCFSMKDQDCVAQFTFILGGTGVDSKKIGKACTLDYVIAGEGRSEGVGASSVILLAVNALQESGVETSIQKHEKQKKAELEEFMKKKDEQEKIEKRKNEEDTRIQHERDEYIYGALSGKIPAKFSRDLDELCKTGKIATKSDVDVYLKNNAAKIAESRLIEKFITEEFSFDSSPLPAEAGPADLKDETWKKYDKGEINTVDEVKAFLKANGRDSIKLRQIYQLAQYRTNVSSFLKSEVITELESQINSGSISTMEQARSFIQSKGVDVNKLDLKIIIYSTPGLNIPYAVRSDLSDKIEKGALKTKEELREVLKDQNINATFE